MSVEALPPALRVDVGRRARIECQVTSGFPVRMVQWLHDGRLIKQHEVKDEYDLEVEGADDGRIAAGSKNGLRMTSVSPTYAPSSSFTSAKMRLSTPSFVWPRRDVKDMRDNDLNLSPDGMVR